MAYAGFSIEDARRIARTVRRSERQAAGRGLGSAANLTHARDVIAVTNVSPMTAPQYGVLWLHSAAQDDVVYYGSENWDARNGPFRCRRPIHGGHERIAIACHDIPHGGTGSAWVAGDHPCIIYSPEKHGPVGRRCFTWPNSFAAHYFRSGEGVPNIGPIWCLSWLENSTGAASGYIRHYRVRLGDWRP